MTEPVRVAACIVTYRSDIEQLKAAVASFQRTTLTKHLAIVDNDSGEDYLKELHQIRGVPVIQSGANSGFGYGHNVGRSRAVPSDYYLVMNPDVVIHEGCLEAMVSYMDEHSDIGLLAPKVLNPDGSLQALNKRHPSVFDLFARRFLPGPLKNMTWVKKRMDSYEMRDVGYDNVCDVPFVSGCFMLFRDTALRKTGGFDEHFFMYLEDCDITRRLNKHHRSVYYPQAVITHHWARGSHKSLHLLWVMIQSMVHYFNKWGWKWL